MDRRERIGDPTASMLAMLSGWQAGIWTALPGLLQSFDAEKLTCVVQPALQMQVRSERGVWQPTTMPLLLDVPVVFPGGGGFGLTFPLASGDEGLVVFASRCVDAWWQSGDVQPQAELRMHDLSDGFFLPGVFSQPRVPAVVPSSGAQLRANDGSILIEVSDGGIRLVGNVAITGNVTATGSITAGLGGGDQVGLQTHNHVPGPAPTPGS